MSDTLVIHHGQQAIEVDTGESPRVIEVSQPGTVLKDGSSEVVRETVKREVVAVAGQGPRGRIGPVGPAGQADVLGAVASEPIGGHRVVQLNGAGEVIYFDNGTIAHIGRAVGISEHAADAGESVSVRRLGPLTESSWTWIPNKPVFAGVQGVLTQTPPTSGVSQVVGVALSATTLIVNLREPLLL